MKPNGCINRADYAPLITMQDGWRETTRNGFLSREPNMITVPFRMSPRCEYTATSELGQADARCIGCERRAPALDVPK